MYGVEKAECNDGTYKWIVVGLHVGYKNVPCFQAGMFEEKKEAEKMACLYSGIPWKEQKSWRAEVRRIKELQR